MQNQKGMISFFDIHQKKIMLITVPLQKFYSDEKSKEMKCQFSGKLQELVNKAQRGNNKDIDFIMKHLTNGSDFAMTRYVDFALSLVENPAGSERIKHYLFNGTLIQRNYASLYLNRLGEWKPVKEAFEKGLIDEIQTYSR
jgi:hypothetical protein